MNKIFDYPDAKTVLVSGDIHGDFRGVVFKLCIQYGLKDTLLIVAGDCGFGFERRRREGVSFSMLDIAEFKLIPAIISDSSAFNPDETIS